LLPVALAGRVAACFPYGTAVYYVISFDFRTTMLKASSVIINGVPYVLLQDNGAGR